MGNKLSVGIPYYESDPAKRDVLKRCIKSMHGHHDELIVLAGKQPTLPRAVNTLLDSMSGDYLIISNDDVELDKGTLRDLCVPDTVTLPTVNGGFFKVFHCHIFCMPRNVYEKLGEADENFVIYWWDTDYALRMMQQKIPVKIIPTVNVLHPEPARTLKSYPSSQEQADKETFVKKHGRTYIDVVSEYEDTV